MANKFDKSIFINKFKAEVAEHLSRTEKALLSLERNLRDETLLAIIEREMHTIKGSSAMMGYRRISELAHIFEDAIASIKAEPAEISNAHFELLLKALDTIKSLLEDKVAWPSSGIEYPFVANLQDKIEKMFRLNGAKKKDTYAGGEKKPQVPVIAQKIDENMDKVLTPPAAEGTSTESVRVDVNKLDDLMNIVGELAIRKIRLEQHRDDLNGLLPDIEQLHAKLARMNNSDAPTTLARDIRKIFEHKIEDLDRTVDEIGLTTSELQNSVMMARMLPLEVIFQTFQRFVRDLSKKEYKIIDFDITGEETELDKTVIEYMQDPLMHMLRNAVDHGIEKPEERTGKDKAPSGKIRLNAYCKGSQIIIEIEDDGRGIDPDAVRACAVKKGIIAKEEASRIPDSGVFDLLFMPGFSTSEEVSDVSGRGIGLDVVKTSVAHLKGMISVSSAVGKGTKFTIKLPLTLAVTLALMIRVCRESFIISCDNIIETISVRESEICSTERREAISVRGEIIPIIRLNQVLNIAEEEHALRNKDRSLSVVIVGLAEKKLAIMVDELVGKREVVAKRLGNHLLKVRYISGATILGSGDVVLMLDVPSLITDSNMLPGITKPLPVKEEKVKTTRSILIVEDSVITRDLERSILEAAGYRVALAKEGLEALKILKDNTFDLILADIAMPGMDGIEMIRKIKEDGRLGKIPVVVVSAKETDEDKRRGLAAGANAYLIKSQFDQFILLDTIERLII